MSLSYKTSVKALIELLRNRQLIEILSNPENYNTCHQAIKSLVKIAGNNLKVVIDALTELLDNSYDEHIHRMAAVTLEKIDPGNPNVFSVLIRLARTEDRSSLLETFQRDQLPLVVSSLKDSFINNEGCFHIMWHCAQNMTYPNFYQAWHYRPSTSHPEVQDTTSVGSTAITQSALFT